jgi:hypothetical protein
MVPDPFSAIRPSFSIFASISLSEPVRERLDVHLAGVVAKEPEIRFCPAFCHRCFASERFKSKRGILRAGDAPVKSPGRE